MDKLKIRSITVGVDSWNISKESLAAVTLFLENANNSFRHQNLSVRTSRLALTPFQIESSLDNRNIISAINWLSEFCRQNSARWFCVPFDTFNGHMKDINSIAIEIAKRYKNAFINFIAAQDNQVNTDAILGISKFVKDVSRLSNNGYDNFRVGASFNCKPNGPFFPFTYHKGENGFSIAPEIVPAFTSIIRDNPGSDIQQVREIIIRQLSEQVIFINNVCMEIEKQTNWKYFGMDLSMAPFPDNHDSSVAGVIELLGVDAFGSFGTVFFTSYLTDILKEVVSKTAIRSVGFNGVMFSLLEDTRLGINSRSKEFSIDSLLAYSSVCGCGIDMVPVPGDVFQEEIASLMLDIAGISSLRQKPLGVRILPIPGKHANEFTDFSYDFLHNTRVKSIKNRACSHSIFETRGVFDYLRK